MENDILICALFVKTCLVIVFLSPPFSFSPIIPTNPLRITILANEESRCTRKPDLRERFIKVKAA
jgi:hypothetical protein